MTDGTNPEAGAHRSEVVTSSLETTWPEPGVAVVTMQRPEVLNAVTVELAHQLTAAFRALAGTRRCRAIVLTGDGRAFCAGADLARASGKPHSAQEGSHSRQDDYVDVIRAMRSCPLPVIAAVNGVAVGFGMAMALAADVRVMAPSARFGVGAVRIGLSAGESGISWHLPRLIGMSRAMDLMLTGRLMGADEASACGLASVAEDTVATALATARAIAANSPDAVRLTKQVAWANLEASFATGLELENRTQALASTTNDFREAIAAFTEKRPPVFSGF